MDPLSLADSIRRSVESAVTVLPEADSPTSASFSPASRLNDTSWTTRRRPKSTLRLLTSSRLIEHFPRVEGIAQRVANEDQEEQREDEHAEGREGDPPRVEIVLAFAEQLAEAGRARRDPQAEKVEAGQRADRSGDLEGHQGHHR